MKLRLVLAAALVAAGCSKGRVGTLGPSTASTLSSGATSATSGSSSAGTTGSGSTSAGSTGGTSAGTTTSGSASSGAGTTTTSSSSTSASSSSSNSSSSSSSGSTGAVFGLDTRPANPTCLAPPRPATSASVTVARVFPNLSFNLPIVMLQAPGDSTRFYLAQKNGEIVTFPNDPNATSSQISTVLDHRAKVESGYNESGLLGMAFDPDYATNHFVYLSYDTDLRTLPDGGTANPAGGGPFVSVISRFTADPSGDTFDPASEVILLQLDQPYENHNGGNIAFGKDGYLYIGFGDGGSGGDPQGNGQNTGSLLGKMLRIDVHGAPPYQVPPDNPFATGALGRPEIYAYGLRNPWRWSFDRLTGDLWVGDVGQNSYEEIDQLTLGGNYGWNTREGAHCYAASSCNTSGLIDPVYDYDRSDGNVIIGGYVYRGSLIPELQGVYVYHDMGSGTVWGLFRDLAGQPAPQVLDSSGHAFSTFAEDNAGELYGLDLYSGELYQLLPGTSPDGGSNFPQTLTATGCVDPGDPTQPAAGVIPYDVNAPLWSDGAGKGRYLALPDGAQIHVNADGDWDLPVGSVLMKHFEVGGQRVETRLLVRHSDGAWAGYSYEWNAAGTDATLLPGAKTRQVGGQTWSYPSRSDCNRCHTAAAGSSLGLETAQLNKPLLYPATGRTANQLDTLDHLGLFDAPLGASSALPALPQYADTSQPLESRAKAYLHINCSICHRPGGPGLGPEDFRYAQSVHDMGACGAAPTQGSLGISNALLVAPGEPARSVLSARMHDLGANRMPPLATHVLDAQGTQLVDAWISSLSSCP